MEATRKYKYKPKPKVEWNFVREQWVVWRGSHCWYSADTWEEAFKYALVLAEYQPDDYEDT